VSEIFLGLVLVSFFFLGTERDGVVFSGRDGMIAVALPTTT